MTERARSWSSHSEGSEAASWSSASSAALPSKSKEPPGVVETLGQVLQQRARIEVSHESKGYLSGQCLTRRHGHPEALRSGSEAKPKRSEVQDPRARRPAGPPSDPGPQARQPARGSAPGLPWQCLYFLPEPQGQAWLRPILAFTLTGLRFAVIPGAFVCTIRGRWGCRSWTTWT